MEIKRVEFVPDDYTKFCENILGLDIDKDVKTFIIDSTLLDLKNNGAVDEIDNFYIDDYNYNFYNYSQKQTTLDKVFFFKNGYKTKDLNYFNFEYNYYKDQEYIKLKTKKGYDEYYNYVCMKHGQFRQDDKYIYCTPISKEPLNELVFYDSIIKQFIEFLIENYKKGLWLNNFNNYSIRYDVINGFSVYDPDVFYTIADNKDLVHISSVEEFLKMYMKVKTRPKDIIYKLKNNKLSVEAATYFYYSYWFIENVSKYLNNNYKDFL